jgi:hypothetical protein
MPRKNAMLSKDATVDVPKLNLPADLVAEVSRRNKSRQMDYRIESLKPSLLERLARLLGLG